jgi:hypothetical protein
VVLVGGAAGSASLLVDPAVTSPFGDIVVDLLHGGLTETTTVDTIRKARDAVTGL